MKHRKRKANARKHIHRIICEIPENSSVATNIFMACFRFYEQNFMSANIYRLHKCGAPMLRALERMCV